MSSRRTPPVSSRFQPAEIIYTGTWHGTCSPRSMLAVHHAHATPTATRGYARRQPEDTVLYGVVQDHVAALLDTARDHSEHGFDYPRFVEREFEKFLACGLLCHG